MVCGGGDYISAPPQCSYKNLLLALADMDPISTPLCDVDEEGIVRNVHSRSLEVLLCGALCKRVNAACKHGGAVSVTTTASEPMRVLLDDLRAYGRKSYLQAITILWSEFPRHFNNTWWYVDYVTASILCMQQPSGLGRQPAPTRQLDTRRKSSCTSHSRSMPSMCASPTTATTTPLGHLHLSSFTISLSR